MTMTVERFETLLQSYGAVRAHWPAGDLAALDAELAKSPRARAAWAEAERLDALLRTPQAPAPSAGLVRRIDNLVAPPRRRRGGVLGWLSRVLPRPVLRPALIVASGLLGLIIGIAATPQQQASPTYQSVDVAAVSGGAIAIRIAELFEDQQ